MSPLLFILSAVGAVAAVVLIGLWGERKWAQGFQAAARYYTQPVPSADEQLDEEVNRLVRGVEKDILSQRRGR